MVWLINANYSTSFYQFSIDKESELALLPRYGISGKGTLNTIKSCCPNSRALCTNGTIYVLKGDTNEWIKISNSSSGSADGGYSGGDIPSYEVATDEEIRDIFKSGSSGSDISGENIATDEEIRDIFS